MLDGILVIFAQVDDASVSLAKTIAACTVEEAAAGAQNGLVDGPLAVVAGDGQIRVFSTEVKSVAHVSTAHAGNCANFRRLVSTSEKRGKILTSTKHSSTHYEGCCVRWRPLRRGLSRAVGRWRAEGAEADGRSDRMDGARRSSDV